MSKAEDNFDELTRILRNGGGIDFYIKHKHARAFYKQTKRINRSECCCRKMSGLYERVRCFVYMVYVGVFNAYLTSVVDRGLERPLLVYETSWMNISSIDGVVLPDGMAKMTFHGLK